jgi:uncharacterized protein (DUF2336 family)
VQDENAEVEKKLAFLDKTSRVTPVLVRLYDSQRLHGLAKENKPLARAELTSAVSELLEMDLEPRESELVADVLIALMQQAALDLRQALAEKLSVVENAPLRLVLQLANDEIEVAAPVLKKSPVLSDLDLIYIIKAKGAEYWQAIAARQILSDQVMNLLADTGDFGTAQALVNNAHIKLTEHTALALADIARNSVGLARPLLRRGELSEDMVKALYRSAGEQIKTFILENYTIEYPSLAQAVDEVVVDMVEEFGRAGQFTPTESMMKAAVRFREKGLLSVKLMMGTLRRGQVQSFIAQFSEFTGLPVKSVEDILMQASGQGLAVACKACGVEKPDFVSIFLLTNSMRDQGRMVDLKDMTKAVEYYTRIREDVARDILENSSKRKNSDPD